MSVGATSRRSTMVFYSDPLDHYSHRVRIVLAEKGISVEIVDASPADLPQEVIDSNPYAELPMLLDRDLVLHEPGVMIEYLDERFPHPPLLPVYPVARAQSRQYLQRIQRDWCGAVDTLLATNAGDPATRDRLRKELRDSLFALSPIFEQKPWFMSDEFTVVDCAMAPILWRLPLLGIELPARLKGLQKYRERLFRRDGFQASLSDREREIRQTY